MPTRHWNYRLAKIHYTYTVEDITKLFGVHRKTVHRWIKDGLPTISRARPFLIHWGDLAEFLQAPRLKNKRKCRPGEIYCVRCRAPKNPAGDMADYQPITTTRGNLIGICPSCETIINRGVSLAKLDLVRGNLDITVPQALLRINESS